MLLSSPLVCFSGMGYTALNVTAPNSTAYDDAHPTRSTENYAHALHDILQDMEDAAGTWYIYDNVPTAAQISGVMTYIHNAIEDVFDYAAGAIDTYRTSGTPILAHPTAASIASPTGWADKTLQERVWKTYSECIKIMYFIYYMWKTEDDPLLLKEKLQELLIAWPLTDTEIILNEEGGQSLHVVPSWKNVDI